MPRTLTLTPATLEDAQSIAIVSRNEVELGLPWTWTPARVKRSILNPEVMVLAARYDQDLAGFGIMEYGNDSAHLNLLAVARGYRRQGIGRQLVRWLESTAEIAGTFLIRLEVRERNLGARRFYTHLGYTERETLPRYYVGRETAVRLSHDLRF
jgi:ribosomal-protein-alanine N-acetyltransferase